MKEYITVFVLNDVEDSLIVLAENKTQAGQIIEKVIRPGSKVKTVEQK